MIVVHIVFKEFQRRQPDKRRWTLFEVDVPDMATLCARLNAGELVAGFSLRVRPLDTGEHEVINVLEKTISGDSVHAINQPIRPLVRFEEEQPA